MSLTCVAGKAHLRSKSYPFIMQKLSFWHAKAILLREACRILTKR